jgi:hypothetical protein
MTTTAPELLLALKSIGYDLEVEGERLRFRYTLEGEPPVDARGLLVEAKELRHEIIEYLRAHPQENLLSFDLAKTLIIKVITDINRGYIPGVIEHTRAFHPDLDRRITDAQGKIDVVCRSILEGRATSWDLRAPVSAWKELELEALKSYLDDVKVADAR